ncbi:23S rRNA (adenine(2503)-C(2))-methyltransferase RlmN [Lentisphaerota bacterium ZTH]|nr:23S rRNA (adenine(2503)-C(2))-methyltransferase RlmN [Lentisphaerota bacterium]WET06906.1 23S rRNA (adenine(2503)-C(2))-methyltransferase RlmN [Lentisphaerota bacterium ZTH]
MKVQKHLLTTSFEELESFVAATGQHGFRTRQIYEWIFRKYTVDPDQMLNIPKALRKSLTAGFIFSSSIISAKTEAPDGTVKLLLSLADNEAVEMVLIPSGSRMTFCLSTQVGCPVQCCFCASGEQGLTRNLKDYEIIEQVYHGIAQIGRLPDNIVFMGIGEGLLNFENLVSALKVLTDPARLAMSPRRITVSTSGYVPGIKKFAALEKPFVLAVSLHAADDATRARIIPDKLRFPVTDILKACDYYHTKTGRMVTFEYTLLKGINDRVKDAVKLADMARRHHAKINLIPYNQTRPEYQRPVESVIFRFRDILDENGIAVTLRLEKGTGAAAACGQLRARKLKKTAEKPGS